MSRWNRHALLVIDLQNDFLNDVPDRERFRRSVERLLGYCRTERIGIYHLRVYKEPDRSNWMPFELLRNRAPCVRGTVGAETPRWGEAFADEPVIPKYTFDGFLGTDLDDRLRDAGIGHLFIAGLVTSICVLTTAIAAMERGYLVTVVSDCVADTEPDHTDTLHRYGNFAFAGATSRELPDLHPLLENRLDAINRICR